MFSFLELGLANDEVQLFHCMEKVAENLISVTCPGRDIGHVKGRLGSKSSFSDASVCSIILPLKFLLVTFWVSSEGGRECIGIIFIF